MRLRTVEIPDGRRRCPSAARGVRWSRRWRMTLSALGVLGLWLGTGCATPHGEGVKLTELSDRVRVEINGQLFTEYVFKEVSRPFCYPLLGPGETPMTRNWPMQTVPAESHDHKHQRSFWYAHGNVNGQDFWSEEDRAGQIRHEKFTRLQSGSKEGVIQARNQWVAKDGTVLCTDDRTLRFYNRPDHERIFDFEITLHAGKTDVTFGDTKEGTMALRLAETMRVKPNRDNVGKPGGHIVNSEGVRDDAAWGKRAAWCDYYGPVDGKIVGVAVFDHPQNPRFPTWWHVRDYGLFAANPFGRHDFDNLPDKTAGNLVIAAGQSVTFRYRFYLHEGDEKQARVADHFAAFLQSK
ncbi:MAG: PmoA family protein [Verrucomicrobiae bacterium]|nr:PmoA family protein [Verrucomicrobiae bacterium]